ncbi:DUF697 domain-containing protein [Pseudanabaena sp. FACHB-2040]|uniref:DUF697 domain-containing protein n=1 Tax=Pseudanabaena sp. FACHB-2040 TaxID=2692859 RepID=UPI001682B743|nr:DUF697 domain-containing protein [Pseudanabaena sp. FACHB-2040]MBD2257587.1 DUF697 domain-containing protein [Pseudanabaena sp. FACHB-2040]
MSPASPATDPSASPPSFLAQTRQTLQQTLQRYTALRPSVSPAGKNTAPETDGPALQSRLEQLESLNARLTSHTLRVAVFGLVSRGKSAVINALMGKPVLETGPLHGVTRWPRSVYWQPAAPQENVADPWQIEFIDTPGLDEIEGAGRAEMAQIVAQQADLILFVVAGDITHTEYTALQQLQAAQKPLLLIFNKIDLYPDVDQEAISANLSQLQQAAAEQAPETAPLSIDKVIRTAANPAPLQVRVEWPDGQTRYEWEQPTPEIEALQTALTTLLYQDGATLVALNTLREARQLEAQLVNQVTTLHEGAADDLIWRFARYKGLVVALNPVALLDLLGGLTSDLVMIRSLARLYGFPITNYQASQLWGTILKSSGLLLLGELTSGLLGAGKSLSALFSLVSSPVGLPALGSAMIVQAAASGYGTYTVGQAAKRYLEQGCTWGPEGLSRVMQTVLEEAETSDVLARLRQDLQRSLNPFVAPDDTSSSAPKSQ